MAKGRLEAIASMVPHGSRVADIGTDHALLPRMLLSGGRAAHCIARDLPAVPYGSARLPQGNASQIEVEDALADIRAEGGNVSLIPDLFWSKDVVLFEAGGKGAKLEVPFDVPADGVYEVYVEVAQASDYGVYTVLLDGEAPGALQLEHEPARAF